MHKIFLQTQKRIEIIDITHQVQATITASKTLSGIVTVYSPHTTAGITVNENADPDVKRDITYFLNQLIPEKMNFHHTEGNSDAHIKGSLINFSQTFIIEENRIQLGQWQGIYFMEFDGARNREVWIKTIAG